MASSVPLAYVAAADTACNSPESNSLLAKQLSRLAVFGSFRTLMEFL
jgi:hypothetical protein